MRIFLIIFSFINAFLYFLIYAYYENILALFSASGITSSLLGFLKTLVLLAVSFLIGLIVSLLTRINIAKSFFDFRLAIIAGIIPFFFLIVSQPAVSNFILINIFKSSGKISDFIFYFLSRQIVWTMWLGFAIGASVRIAFKKKLKHQIDFSLDDNEPSE
ncbi:MAG: hypothetical protein JW997_03705 [Actinobacteria bacterium]|nr:hypothetical protein [Actinomycetota bacterium]